MKALQAELFENSVSPSGNEPPVGDKRGVPAVAEEAGVVPDGFRYYQEEARTAWLARIGSSSKRSIIKLPTGSGKTRLGIGTVRHWLMRSGDDHCLWLAPRIFLIEDAIERLGPALGRYISREQGQHRGGYSRMTVGSIRSFVGRRLEEMDPDRYGLIVVDECQEFSSPSAEKIANHFKRAHIGGMSATPGPSPIFGGRKAATVYEKDILWAISEGFFVPIEPKYEDVVGLDLTDVDSSDGDLKLGELDRAVAKVAKGIAKITWEKCGDRPTLIYCPGVATVHAVTSWLNERRPGCAEATDAKTPPEVRRETLRRFREGETQYIVNCGIYLYGLDVPTCRAIVIARPTEDRDLWEQMVGRGGRPEPGIGELDTSPERCAAILASSKPNMLLLVLSGEAGKHSLCDIADLDETADAQVRSKASKDIRENPEKPLADALRDARAWQRGENERIRLAMQQVMLQSQGGTFDPFRVNEKPPLNSPLAPQWTREPSTDAQRKWLRWKKLPWDITKGQAQMFRGKFEQWAKAQPGNPMDRGAWLPSEGIRSQWIAEILHRPMAERTVGWDG